MPRAINILAFAGDNGVLFNVQFDMTFQLSVKDGIGVEARDVAIALAQAIDSGGALPEDRFTIVLCKWSSYSVSLKDFAMKV